MKNIFQYLKKDVRHFQILFLTIFLGYGTFVLHWNSSWKLHILCIATTLAVQFFWTHYTSKNYRSLKSALISALGLCILLKTNEAWVIVFTAFITISSKFILKYKGKHIFNPTNIGIVSAIFFTQQAWISPGVWGSNANLWFFVGALGVLVVSKVKRLDVSFAFLSALFLFEFSWNILYKNWPADYLIQHFSSGSLLLFSFFMITDPMTAPNNSKARIIWGILLGFISFLVSNFWYISGAPFYVLFFMSLAMPIIDTCIPGKKFEWVLEYNSVKPSFK